MKKLLALCLTVMLVVAMVPVFAVSAADEAAFVVSTAEGVEGDTVTVTVSLANNPGIVSAKLKVAYDADVLELKSAKAEGVYAANAGFGPTTRNPFTINWVDTASGIIYADDGAFATLTFDIKADAAIGDSAITVSYDPDDVYVTDDNNNYNNVTFAVENGAVKVNCGHKTTETLAAVAPTCTATGLTEGSKCTVAGCGEVLVAQKTVDALGHTEVVEGAKDATCTEAGSTGTTKCSTCGETLEDAKVIDALGHTEGDAVKENIVGDICVDAGSYDEVVYCTVCNAELSRENKEVEAIGHTELSVNGLPATCTEAGYTGDKYCSVCDEELQKGEEIAALGHKYVDGVCENCGEAEPKAETPADDDKKPATDDKTENKTENKTEDKTEDKGNVDTSDKSAPTSDNLTLYLVFAMLIAAAVASVVVLKKKA